MDMSGEPEGLEEEELELEVGRSCERELNSTTGLTFPCTKGKAGWTVAGFEAMIFSSGTVIVTEVDIGREI